MVGPGLASVDIAIAPDGGDAAKIGCPAKFVAGGP
jgi:hypothetical protein